MSDTESDKDDSKRNDLRKTQSGGTGNSKKIASLRRRNGNGKSAVGSYFKKILTTLNSSSSSSSSNDSSGDDDDEEEDSNDDNKSGEEESYESDDDDDTDWSSASDDDNDNLQKSNKKMKISTNPNKLANDKNDAGNFSDSSDGTCEKCPICLLSFRDREIGIPETCDHKFCLICIEEWSKNVSTCPIDRKNFSTIHVTENYESDKVVRKLKVEVKNQEDTDVVQLDLTFCEVCRNPDREECMLLCDECNRGYHLFCLTPPLEEVPQGSWYCDNCFSSESSYSDNEVQALLEDVRELGEPSTRLRTHVRNTPRITRTRQSERIRAAIIARTRFSRNPVVIDPNQPSTSRGIGTLIDVVNRRFIQNHVRMLNRQKTTRRAAPTKKRGKRVRRRRTRRIKRQIVEYGLDQDANKFPLEVIAKKSKRKYKRKCKKSRKGSSRHQRNGLKELVKCLPGERSTDLLAKSAVPKLHIFGVKDQLDYFSSDGATDDENSSSIGRDIIGGGGGDGGTLVQTSSSIRTRIGSRRLLNRQKSIALNINNPVSSIAVESSPIDLLSSILDTQERWHTTRNVRIAQDGRLILENQEKKENPEKKEAPPINPDDINQAPMYPRGGGGNNTGGGSGRYSGGGGYSNNNRGGYYNNRGGGGNNSNYNRSSTDGNFNGSGSYNNYNNSNNSGGGYNQSNDFGGSSNFRGRGRYPINNYSPRIPNTPNNNNNSNIRFKFNRRSLNLTNNTNNPLMVNANNTLNSSLAVQNQEITGGLELVSNSNNRLVRGETIDSSTSELIGDEIPTPSNIIDEQPNDEDIPSSSINSENLVTSSSSTELKSNPVDSHKIEGETENKTEYNEDDDMDDDCPNFSVYSAVSMDIAKESENSSQGVGDAANKESADDTAAPIDKCNNDDEEKEEDLVQLDDDDMEENEPENNEPQQLPVAPQIDENLALTKTSDGHPDDDDDDDDDDGDDDDDIKAAKETIPLELNKDNINKSSNSKSINNSSSNNNKKEKVLELYDDSDWEEWNIDKNDEEKLGDTQKNPEIDNIDVEEDEPPAEEKFTEAISEEDERSYTPCLDEKQQKPDTHKLNSSNDSETPFVEHADDNDEDNLVEITAVRPSTSGIGGLDTELISDEDEEEIFTEDAQKDRNETKSRNGVDKSKWNKKRGDGNNSFKKISKNTKERNYRDKDKKRKRSRSRSNDKENKMRGMRKRDKRKDLERYNVRTIISERPRPTKDKYGRDLSARILKSPTRSKSRERRSKSRQSRSSSSRRRTPPIRRSNSRRRSFSPRRRSSSRENRSRSQQRSFGKPRKRTISRSRSRSRGKINGKPKTKRHRSWSSKSRSRSRTRSRSISKSRSFSISRSRTRTPIDRPIKQHPINRRPRKKEARGHRELSIERSVTPRPTKRKKKVVEKNVRRRRQPSFTKWSMSRSKTPENVSWTPPYQADAFVNATPNLTLTVKNKEPARKKKEKKRKERRKEQTERKKDKKRQRAADKHSTTVPPSKEVFASGNNILVSVSFNKNQEQPPQQTTVVTLPASRSQIVSKRREEHLKKTRKERNKEIGGRRHKKIDLKPVAIIDLDRSPFKEMTPSPKDVIVLDDDTDEERDVNKEKKTQDTQDKDQNHEEDVEQPMRVQQASQPQSPVVDDSFDILSSGPKTPPEPPTVKFSMSVKSKNTKLRTVNPLHDAIEEQAEVLERESDNAAAQKDLNKIGPNTPPEPAPTSPDAYDPFEPTKSPSPSPSPAPPDIGDMSTNDDDVSDNLVESTQECINEEKRPSQITQEKILNPVELVMALINNKTTTTTTTSSSAHADITSTSGDNFNIQTNESQIIDIASMQSVSPNDKSDEASQHIQKSITVLSNVLLQTGGNSTTSQSRVTNVGTLLLPNMSNSSARSPVKSQFNNPTSTTSKSSPIKAITLTKQTSQKTISITQLPKSGGMSNNTSSSNNNSSGDGAGGGNIDMGDDGGNDFGSPYSPGSSDYDDLFEPPMDTSSPPPILPPIRSHKTAITNKPIIKTTNNNPLQMFDNLFGSTSPINHMRLSSNKTKAKQANKTLKKTPVKVYHKPGMGKLSDDQLQILDDLPSSAVELQVKDKFLRKLNRQERVVEEVKLVLKPHYNKKHITKEEYKNIMRRSVPKICHNRTGEINPQKIQNLIEAYVKKYRHRRKILNNNAVSSSNKCVEFLNKLN